MEPLCPEPATESSLAVLLGRVPLVRGTRRRARALLALGAAAARLGLAPPRLRHDLTRVLETIAREGGADTGIVLARIERELPSPDPALLDRLGIVLLGRGRPRIVLDLVGALLASGRVDEARALAGGPTRASGRSESDRRSVSRVATTGVREGAFLPDPLAASAERFPASEPHLRALLRALVERRGRTASSSRAREMLARVGGPIARLQAPVLAWIEGSLDDGLAAGRGIRAGGLRRRALETLAGAALAGGEFESVRACWQALEPGLARERVALALAVDLAGRSDLGPAGEWLARVRHAALATRRRLVEVETALAAGHVETAVRRLRALPPRLAEFDRPAGERAGLLVARIALADPDPDRAAGLGILLERLGRPRLVPGEIADRFGAGDAEASLGLAAIRALGAGCLADAVACEWIARAASRLSAGVQTRPSGSGRGGAASLDRALEDEVLSASEEGRQRRRVLVRAARHVLLHHARESGPSASRLRSLANLGGELAIRTLEEVLGRMPADLEIFDRGVAVLAGLQPESAARILLARSDERTGADAGLEPLLVDLENRGALEEGFASAWMRLARAAPGAAWLGVLVRASFARTGAPPTRGRLEAVRSRLARRPVPAPEAILDELDRAWRPTRDPVGRVADLLGPRGALLRELRDRPPSLPSGSRSWGEDDWRRVLARIAVDVGDVAPSVVRAYARRLRGVDVADRLLAGGFPGGDDPGPWTLESPKRRLRYLDKERDLFTFLRFADCQPCCYSSDSSWYRRLGSQRSVLEVWKDPLSFVFHVERAVGSSRAWRPTGFVLGGFGLAGDEEPVLLLNGVYARPRRPASREAILATIESALARPLGMRRIGIANRHGGWGWLPGTYVRRSESVTRCRALRSRCGDLVRRASDDVSGSANERAVLEHLFWKVLG